MTSYNKRSFCLAQNPTSWCWRRNIDFRWRRYQSCHPQNGMMYQANSTLRKWTKKHDCEIGTKIFFAFSLLYTSRSHHFIVKMNHFPHVCRTHLYRDGTQTHSTLGSYVLPTVGQPSAIGFEDKSAIIIVSKQTMTSNVFYDSCVVLSWFSSKKLMIFSVSIKWGNKSCPSFTTMWGSNLTLSLESSPVSLRTDIPYHVLPWAVVEGGKSVALAYTLTVEYYKFGCVTVTVIHT